MATHDRYKETTNGVAMAAFLAAGIGAFAVGFIVVLNGIGWFPVPTLYSPAGGVSSRTTLAALFWVASWIVLHRRWRGQEVSPWPILVWCLVLIGLGLLFTFPPFWSLL